MLQIAVNNYDHSLQANQKPQTMQFILYGKGEKGQDT